MYKPLELAILKTLSYSAIFSYPLTKKEIWQYLIWEEKEKAPSHNAFQKALKSLNLSLHDSYYYLNHQNIIDLRLSRQSYSSPKKTIAQKASVLLQQIPTIKHIGISGALSLNNAGKNDDIDLFIICQKNTLWLTRFLATFLLDFKKIRRKPSDKKIRDKICLNMFMEENYLILPIDKQNLYTAHEICQLKPIYDKDDTYQKFLTANSWVLNYLPNAISGFSHPKTIEQSANWRKPVSKIIHYTLYILNYSLMVIQLLYMRRHRTKEIIDSHILFFHPRDISIKILKKYDSRLALISQKE